MAAHKYPEVLLSQLLLASERELSSSVQRFYGEIDIRIYACILTLPSSQKIGEIGILKDEFGQLVFVGMFFGFQLGQIGFISVELISYHALIELHNLGNGERRGEEKK